MKRIQRSLLSVVLTAACLFIGYSLYRLNHYRDPLVWGALTFGLLGILLSVLRQKKGGSA